MKNYQKENPIKNINVKIGVKFNIVWCRQDLRDKKVLKRILNFLHAYNLSSIKPRHLTQLSKSMLEKIQ